MSHSSAVSRDFNRTTLSALTARGITLLSATTIPAEGDMPFANASRGYSVSDNGMGRILRFADVLAIAEAA